MDRDTLEIIISEEAMFASYNIEERKYDWKVITFRKSVSTMTLNTIIRYKDFRELCVDVEGNIVLYFDK
jgi:hypothetical protein